VQSEISSSLKQASSQRDRNMNQFHTASLLHTAREDVPRWASDLQNLQVL